MQAHVPSRRIENLAFFNHDFTSYHLVARRRVAGKCDPIHIKLTILVDVNGQIDHLLRFVEVLKRHGREVNVASLAVQLLQVVKTLPKPLLVENLPRHQSQNRSDENLREEFVARDLHFADAVLLVFFDIDGDVVTINRFFPERNG